MFACGRGLVGVLIACIALASCGDRDDVKTERSSAERVAAELDMCAEEPAPGFAQNVCANRPLAALDTQIREALVAESADISDAGAQMLVQNQRRWREAARLSCGVDEAAEPTPEQRACLEGEFRVRLQRARAAVEHIGGYTFQRMELIDAAPVPQDIARALGPAAPPAVQRDISFPRIDGPQTPEVQRFNDLVAQRPRYELTTGPGEVVQYEIVYAGPEIISVRFNVTDQAIGTAHTNDSIRATTVLISEGRLVAENDVFRDDSDWRNFLAQRVMTDLTAQFREVGFVPPERDVRETVTKPHLWLITERGLIAIIPPYALGGPQLGAAEVMISWADLRPYLNPAAPAPIRATS